VRVRDSALLLLRYAFWFLAAELILHFFYFSALQFNPQIMEVSFRNVAADFLIYSYNASVVVG
jgi:hypothetical protein